MLELILGGARSGKTALAQQLAAASGLEVVYVATAQAQDQEMQARIQRHRQERPVHWELCEEPLRLADALERLGSPQRCLLVDCLTLWLTNLLLSEQPDLLEQQLTALEQLLPSLPGRIILVSNETGLGVVPLGELSRRFVDETGFLHQRLAQRADRVIFTVAGLPWVMNGEPL